MSYCTANLWHSWRLCEILWHLTHYSREVIGFVWEYLQFRAGWKKLLNGAFFKLRSVVNNAANYWDVHNTDDGMGEGCSDTYRLLVGNVRVGRTLQTGCNWLGVNVAFVFLQIITNSYKEEVNVIGVSYKVSVYFVTALSTVPEKRQQLSSDSSTATGFSHSVQFRFRAVLFNSVRSSLC